MKKQLIKSFNSVLAVAAVVGSSSLMAAQPPEYQMTSLTPLVDQIQGEFGDPVGIIDVNDQGWVFIASNRVEADGSSTRLSHIWDSQANDFVAKGLPGIIIDVRGNFYSYATNTNPDDGNNRVVRICQVSDIEQDPVSGNAAHGASCVTREDNSLFGPIFKDFIQLSTDHSLFNSSGWTLEIINEAVPGSENDEGNTSIPTGVVAITSLNGDRYIIPNQTQLQGEIGNCETNFFIPEGDAPTLYFQQCLFGEFTNQRDRQTVVKAYTPDTTNPGQWIIQDFAIPQGESLGWVRSDNMALLAPTLLGGEAPVDPSVPVIRYCDITQCKNTIQNLDPAPGTIGAFLRFNEGSYVTGFDVSQDAITNQTGPFGGNVFIADASAPNDRRYLDSILYSDGTANSALWFDFSLSGEYGLLARGIDLSLNTVVSNDPNAARPEFVLIQQNDSCAGLSDTAAQNSGSIPATGQSGELSDCTNLIRNGSFETHGDLNHGAWGTFRHIDGWKSVGRRPFEIQTNGVGGVQPFDGNALLELDAHRNGKIKQVIDTTAGETYQLQLAYSPRVASEASWEWVCRWQYKEVSYYFFGHRSYWISYPSCKWVKRESNTNRVDVFWNGSRIAVLNGNTPGWQQHSFTVTATGSQSSLVLKARGLSDSRGGLIDAVRLSEDLGTAEFVSTPLIEQQAGSAYSYATELTGIANERHYFLDDAPEGMTIDTNGVIQWDNPTEGEYTVTVRSIDACGREAVQTYTLSVFLPGQCLL